jgi:urease accessory protein
LDNCLVQVDLPVAARLYEAWSINNIEAVKKWSATLLACRESFELREEDRQTGQALAKLLADMDVTDANSWIRKPYTTLPAMFTLAAVNWNIPKQQALTGLIWSWLENQVLCAVKLVPLGQVAGQRLLYDLAATIPDRVKRGLQIEDDEIGGSVFGLALASSRHEMQYSRLFRS